jgi:Zn-dependent protease
VGESTVPVRFGASMGRERLSRQSSGTVVITMASMQDLSAAPPLRPSPVFLGILAAIAGFGWLCWNSAIDDGASLGASNAKYYVFGFVFIGWIASLCIHEYSHARVALWGGDRSVIGRGYLTLNPLKYLHPGLSLVMPLVFLAIGGIGLPGGAVWINRGAIRDKRRQSLMSIAGPASNFALGAALAAVVKLGGATFSEKHLVFGSALSYLAQLQFLAAILNMLPVPGFDGFGAIEPFLSRQTLAMLAPVRQYGIFVLFMLSYRTNALSFVFDGARSFAHFFGVPNLGSTDFSIAELGRELFRSVVSLNR